MSLAVPLYWSILSISSWELLWPYHGSDANGEEEAVIERVDRVIALHGGRALQEDRARVEPLIRPEDAEPSLLVSLHQSPASRRNCDDRSDRGRTIVKSAGVTGMGCIAS